MNTALIFAGGTGVRMTGSEKPKQFLEVNGRAIIIHTLLHFEKHPEIDKIVVVCLTGWMEYLENLLTQNNITKVAKIVEGGSTGQESIYNGLCAMARLCPEDSIVLIHDGVRPLINSELITKNIDSVRKYGSCITCVKTTETFVLKRPTGLTIAERDYSLIARAPQSFVLMDILSAHTSAKNEKRSDFIDSCTLMHHYGFPLHTELGPVENIKITTPLDFHIFEAIGDL